MNELMNSLGEQGKRILMRVQNLYDISYLCMARGGAARVERRFRAKSRGHCMPCHDNDWTLS